jgi:hypothetical protein
MLELVAILSAIPILLLFTLSPIGSVFAASGTVTQESVHTGNHDLDKQINNFYQCVSDTHKDPPPLFVVDQCYSDNVGHGGFTTFIPHNEHHFFHFNEVPPSIIIHSFNHHHIEVIH